MKSISVFSYKSYRDYLKAKAEEADTSWGALTRLAKAAGCHRPYLSKVLNDEAHLTPSQLFALTQYWKLNEPHTEYLLRLLEIEKTNRAEYREYLAKKNADLKRREENLAQVVARPIIESENLNTLYYSSWVWPMVHVLTSIPEFQTAKAISERISMPIAQVESILSTLQNWGSVREEKGRWIFAGNEHHIASSTPHVTFHHSNWRQQAILNSQRQLTDSVHFTVVQSISHEDYIHIRELVLGMIQKVTKVAAPSPAEKVYAFNCDFFEP